MRTFSAFLTAALVAALAATGCAHAEDGAAALDVVGLRLGMTAEEAKAALLAHDATLTIEERTTYFSYSDGEKAHRTDSFLSRIDARRRDWGDSFTLEFSPPPDGGKVVAITRRQNLGPNAPTAKAYRDALVEKYGPALPPGDSNLRGSTLVVWEFPKGGIRCTPFAAGPSSGNRYVGGRLDEQFRDGGADRDPSQCRSYLAYNLGSALFGSGDKPVKNVSAYMVDVGTAIATFRAANEWVAGLKAAATKERLESTGTAPKL